MSSNYRTPDRASASALSQSRKLLDGYDEEPLAKALFARIASGHYEPNPINKNPRYISIFSVFAEHGNRPDYGAYHAQLAFVKALNPNRWIKCGDPVRQA